MKTALRSKYIDLSDQLDRQIQVGRWGEKLPGLVRLSEEFEVNPRTVAKAVERLAEMGRVEVHGTLGTRIIPQRDASTRIIVLVGDIFTEHDCGVEKVTGLIREKGAQLLNLNCDKQTLEDNPAILSDIPVAGFLFANSFLNADCIRHLDNNSIPYVSLNRHLPESEMNYVDCDGSRDIDLAIERFLALGCKRIARLSYGSWTSYQSKTRDQFLKAVAAAGGEAAQSRYLVGMDQVELRRKFGTDYAVPYAGILLDQLTADGCRPDAFYLNGLALGKAVCAILESEERRVPDDVTIICDADEDAATEDDFFSVIQYSLRDRARAGVEGLFSLINGEFQAPYQKLLPKTYTPKQSTSGG